jgi:hypothetical protein
LRPSFLDSKYFSVSLTSQVCRIDVVSRTRETSIGRPCKQSPRIPTLRSAVRSLRSADTNGRVDGYQECLHCQYTHRSFSVLYPPTFYAVHNYGNYSQHIADPEKSTDGLFLYFFPICTLNFYNGGMSSFRVCPTAKPGVTRMEFDYYHEKDGEEFEEYFKFVRKVAMEDYELCETAQANLEQGVYCQGVLNPKKEGGVIREYTLRLLQSEGSWCWN